MSRNWPSFLYSVMQQENKKKIEIEAEIGKLSVYGGKTGPVSEQIIIQELSERGLISGEIRAKLFKDYSVSESLTAIRKYMNKKPETD